ncbi:MAG TPA: alpha/beta hydrolase [Candidatus Binatia bacterium]|jgi:pimeloyl-ACP methyl ester carboxylesterase|nr:alpha/beta hydrolase [Candidatus Binatia bacterium]
MQTELISIPTPTHPLDAAYYTPDGPIKGAAMYCHGNQMNFYVCAARFLAPQITSLGYVFMPFNRRGHDSVSTRDSRECVGAAYQTVAEGIEDNELAAKYLADRGFNFPIVIGHSNGGVLASEHVVRHPETRALILLSAHAGGNRLTNPPSARNFSLAGDTDEQTKEAEALVAAGKSRQLMLISAWWWVISARTYLDRLTNAPDLVENAKRIKCPVLFIRGDQEPMENYPAERFKENCAGPCEVAIIPNCDHFYVGAEERVAKIVTDWLKRTLG